MDCNLAVAAAGRPSRLSEYVSHAPLAPPSPLRAATAQLQEMRGFISSHWDEIDPALKTRLRLALAGATPPRHRPLSTISAAILTGAWVAATLWHFAVRRADMLEYLSALVGFIEAFKQKLTEDLRKELVDDLSERQKILLGREEIAAGKFVPLRRR